MNWRGKKYFKKRKTETKRQKNNYYNKFGSMLLIMTFKLIIGEQKSKQK